MRVFFCLMVGAVLPAAAMAQDVTYSCTLTAMCNGAECQTLPEGPATAARLSLSADGAKMTLTNGTVTLTGTRIGDGAVGQSFLVEQPGKGIGLVTLTPDNRLLAHAQELRSDGVGAGTMLGDCGAENG